MTSKFFNWDRPPHRVSFAGLRPWAVAVVLVTAGVVRGANPSPPPDAQAHLELTVALNGSPVATSFESCGSYLIWAKDPAGRPPGGQQLAPQVLVLPWAGELVAALPPQTCVDIFVSSPHPKAKGIGFWSEAVCDLAGSLVPLPEIAAGVTTANSSSGILPVILALQNSTTPAYLSTAAQISRQTWSLRCEEASGVVSIKLSSGNSPAAIRLGGWHVGETSEQCTVTFRPEPSPIVLPPPPLPPYLPAIEAALVEWDWRLQDGIGTPREPVTFQQALETLFGRIEVLLRHWGACGEDTSKVASLERELRQFRKQVAVVTANPNVSEFTWQSLWRQFHWWRRKVLLETLLPAGIPLVFVKHVPSAFSHQLTQYYGRDARPGGGIFLLPSPGSCFRTVDLVGGRLPVGSYQHVDISPTGEVLAFAFCQVDKPPPDREAHADRFFHLYELDLRSGAFRQLTDGPFDDFAPRYLPDGRIVFISTRRGGFHRCGRGPCPVYTLAIRQQDGTVDVLSFHETHEWDPAVLPDGRILYTRWDYVDRHAVFYQQLWTVRADGTFVQAYYGNGTFNPVGIWEAVAVPGSQLVMATAAAHHAMTAGSIILLDVRQVRDGPAAIKRLTPDAPFPESETPVIREPGGSWHAPVGVDRSQPISREARRWPGHCYRSPYPLSEDYFICAYSYDPLIGEPTSNRPNMFGLYLVDRFGNKELLYRDLNHSSLWPALVMKRPTPLQMAPATTPISGEAVQKSFVPTGFARQAKDEGGHGGAGDARATSPRAASKLPLSPGPIGSGLFILQNVYDAWPPLPAERITHLRIVQVLPKSTPHINTPPVGAANASPGKQVLGTVPVEADGSAFFEAPAGIPLAFQALDEKGQAVQIMRSITYLQPGEVTSCIGCHEPRHKAPPIGALPLALRRGPSTIAPGPKGSRPLSYPLLIQPILDRHCLRCHNDERAEGGVNLSSRPAGQFSQSYVALVRLVRIAAWDGRADFTQTNCEPYTAPDFFGARGSPLMKLLLSHHGDVELSAEEIAAFATWMDTNALFYGTFDPADQARQLRGEEIAGPAWE